MALGIFICRTPRSFGKVKGAVDVFGDICQASLLHLTKAAVSFLNSFSGHIITGLEKARRGARVQLIILRLFSIERSLFLRKKQACVCGCDIQEFPWLHTNTLTHAGRVGCRTAPGEVFREMPSHVGNIHNQLGSCFGLIVPGHLLELVGSGVPL